jgi:hypothetical protein
MTAALLQQPRWHAAAQALISGCLDLHGDEPAVALLETVCQALGDELYPAFLRVLAEVGRHGDHAARQVLAAALVHALRSGRLPNGRRGAWGARGGAPGLGGTPGLRTRSLGPLEFLCAWAGQGDEHALEARGFEAAAVPVLALVDAHPAARTLYCDKLLAEAQDPLEGTLSRSTRQAVVALAQAWAAGATPAEACARFLAALPQAPLSLAAAAARARSVATSAPPGWTTSSAWADLPPPTVF